MGINIFFFLFCTVGLVVCIKGSLPKFSHMDRVVGLVMLIFHLQQKKIDKPSFMGYRNNRYEATVQELMV